MPTLRGHHLICLHFFNGEGYDQRFIKNLANVLDTVKSKGLKIGSGGDDVCRKCPYLKNGSCQYSQNAENEIREMDRIALELLDLAVGDSVSWKRIAGRIPEIFTEWFTRYCSDCQWAAVCECNNFFSQLRPANSSQ